MIERGVGLAKVGGIFAGIGAIMSIGELALISVCPMVCPALITFGGSALLGGSGDAALGGALAGISKIIKEIRG